MKPALANSFNIKMIEIASRARSWCEFCMEKEMKGGFNMKFFKQQRFWVIGLLISLVILMTVYPVEAKQLTKQDCLDAFKRCGIDAVIALVSGGFVAGLIYMGGCLAGYDFCVRYIITG